MKRNYLLASLLAIAAMFTGCSQDEEIISTNPSHTYKASVFASKNITGEDEALDPGTRALFVGGNNRRFATLWDEEDLVRVYKAGVEVGTMSLDDLANQEYQGTKDAYLSGELTGDFAVGDEVTLYLTSKTNLARSYTGQKGTINDLSKNFSYQVQTVRVAEVSGSTIRLEKANMDHQQAYLRFVLTDEDGNRLHPKQLIISAEPTENCPGRIVTSVAANGTETYGDLVINTEMDCGEYPGELFVSVLNESDNTKKVNYRLTVVNADDVVYTGPSTTQVNTTDDRPFQAIPPKGALNRVWRKLSKGTPEITMASQKKMIVGTTSTRTPADVKIGAASIKDNATVTYSSSNTTVASVNPTTGEVTANAVGNAVITATVVATDDYSSVSASYTLTVEELTAQAVDLGLSVLWADMNIGAESATDVGTYFAWGETVGYTDENNYDKYKYDWDTYKWGNINPQTKYNTTDGLTRLEDDDDAAIQNWGGSWRMPTKTEMDELINNTDRERVVIDDHVYFKLMNKSDHEKYILLPVSGAKVEPDYIHTEMGLYWASTCSSVAEKPYFANLLHFTQDNINNLGTRPYWIGRVAGLPIRAVQPKNN